MFLDANYLLDSESARTCFAAIGALPIVDPHNHADVAAIAENRNFTDLWQIMGATDHYVWEMMRKCAVPEERITGSASAQEKFRALAAAAPDFAGNPCYEWLHLDLRFLGIDELLCAENADVIWEKGLKLLASPENRPQEILRRLNVETMCSTDDPVDLLTDHSRINTAFGRILVRPTWRPDRAMKIEAPDFMDYVAKLEKRFECDIESLDDLIDVLRRSHDYFAAHDCHVSDHGVEVMPKAGGVDLAREAFLTVCAGEPADPAGAEAFRAYVLAQCAEMNAEKDWITQLHIGPVRNVRRTLFDTIGADAGGDISNLYQDQLPGLLEFLNRFDGRLSVVLYCLEPMQQAMFASVSRAFGERVRLGSAWWLNDTPEGMKRQLEYISSVDVLSNFAGMVSDSRKLLSYGSRFEVFRRVLSSVVGGMIERGAMPEAVGLRLVRRMAYENVKTLFRF